MPDTRFFTSSGPKTLAALAEVSGAALADGADPALEIKDVAPLDIAGAGEVTFLDNVKYKDQFLETKAAACIVAPEMEVHAPKGVALLLTPTPYKAYALVARAFYPETPPAPSVSPTAHVDPTASIGEGCVIEACAVIGAGAEIGPGTWVEPNAVIGTNVKIGTGCRIGPNVSVSHALIGDHVRLYPGCRVGQDGFGFAPDPAGHIPVPQLGRVIIEDGVQVGANTTIDRGSGPDTVIGAGTWIDNLVQIAHNVKVGRGCIIVGQVGVSGSSVIGDFAVLAGQAGVAGHLTVGKGARVGAKAGVMRDVPDGEDVLGAPALPIRETMRQIAALKKLASKKE